MTTSFQWTNTSTSGSTDVISESAAVTVGGPAFGYDGPTDVLVYWDTVYSSFMFAFATTPPIASGKVVDVSGVPIAQREVTLVVDDHTLKTFTDLHGDFRFYGRPADRKTPPRESPGSRNFRGMIDKGPAKRLAPAGK